MFEAIRHWALGLGPLGLFLIALLDASFLSFPQVNDALILVLSAKHPVLMPAYAGLSTLGSVIGSLVLAVGFAPDGAVAATGSETLITLRFTRIAAGSDRIDFALQPGSAVAERIVDDKGQPVSARFGPGHGGDVTIP